MTRTFHSNQLLAKALLAFLMLLFMLNSPALGSQQSERKKILILFSFRPNMPVASQWDRGIRSIFEADKVLKSTINIEYLDLTHFNDERHVQLLIDLYRHKYSNPKPDLIIPVLNASVDLMLKYGTDLFPDVPIVFGGVEKQFVNSRSFPPNITGYLTDIDYTNTLELALDLHPDTRNITVVAGAGPVVRRWTNSCRKAYQAFEERFDITYLIGHPMETLLQKVESLPSKTVVISLPVLKDGVGKEYVGNESLALISQASSAPVYTFWDVTIGTGVVGGYVSSFEGEAKAVARLGLRILRGEKPADIPVTQAPKFSHQFDWRQLKRWSIPEQRLPVGSIVRFREIGTWDRYHKHIIAAVAILVLQSLIISFLLYQRRKRLQAEKDISRRLVFEQLVSDLSSRFIRLPADQAESNVLDGLARVGGFWDADRAFLFRFNREKTQLFISHIWQSEGSEEDQSVLGSNVREMFPWLYQHLIDGQDIVVSDVENLRAMKALKEYKYCQQIGIRSFLVIPVQVADAPLCAIGLDFFRTIRNWPDDAKERLRLIGEIFAIAIERTHSEQRKKALDQKYRTVADYTYGWEYWQNPDGSLQYISPSCERISGYSAQEFVESPELLQEIIVPEDQKVWDGHAIEAEEMHEPGEIQFRLKRKDGEIRWIEHVCQPVTDHQGVLLGFRASNRDITKRKFYRSEKDELQAELAHMDRVVTISTLTSALAHEINQPLAAMRSYAQAALRFMEHDRPEYDNVRKALQGIVADNKRAADVVNRLRALVKKGTLQSEAIDINSLINDVLGLVNSELVLRDTSVSLDLDPKAPVVRADPVQIQQVLINLLTNALDAMDDQPIDKRTIAISTRTEKVNKILVSILDSGEGISHDAAENIFSPFHTTKSSGMGLGLSICKSIIEAHGGRIYAENNPGGGAVLSFSLNADNLDSELTIRNHS